MDAFAFNILLISILAFIIYLFSLNTPKSYNGVPLKSLLQGILSFLFPNLELGGDHDEFAELLERNKGTMHINQYSWLTGAKTLVTSDPANARHVLSTNFSNYPKGPKWKEEIDFLGDTVFSTDLEEWEQERKFARSFTSHHKLYPTMTKIVWDRIQTGLIPLLQHVSKQAMPIDLQGLFQKYILDVAWMMSIGYNPNFLGIENFRKDPFSEAIEDACEAVLFRTLMPYSSWKLHRWLGIGKEKKLKRALETIDRVFEECISKKREEESGSKQDQDQDQDQDQEGFYLEGFHYQGFESGATRKRFKDSAVSIIFATQDTTSSVLTWFFSSLAKHPSVEAKIFDEILENLQGTQRFINHTPFKPQELNNLVYLHAALCETLRLFPPGHILSRTAVRPDTLPSGHRIDGNTNVVVAVHAMGRMASVWGDDCYEFKPERWITEQGEIKRVPHYQFPAFSAGSRICLGKEFAFTVMKATIATIIYNYKIQIPKDHPSQAKNSIVFHMKHGPIARINSRWT